MITTVTPNPSLDRTLHLPRFEPGHVNRATATMVEPSGKGVNVALALHGVGVPVRAVLPVGGSAGHEIALLLDDLGLDHVDVPIAGTLRSNISLVEADGRTSKVNEPGPRLSEAEADALCAKALSASDTGEWVVWAGSLPVGFTPQRLADAVAGTRAAGRLVALDCSGHALEHALAQEGGRLPHLVKPNAEELAEVTGRSLSTLGDVADAAHVLIARGRAHRAGQPRPRWCPPCRRRPAAATARHRGRAQGRQHCGRGRRIPRRLDRRRTRRSERASDALANALRFGATAVEHEGTLLGVPDPRRPVAIVAAAAQTPLRQ